MDKDLIPPYVIAINGPPGVGKTWLRHQIYRLLNCDPGNGIESNALLPIITTKGFNEALYEETFDEMNWTDRTDDGRARFKVTVFNDGMTGREHLIRVGTYRRAQDEFYWCNKLLTENWYCEDQPRIILIDCLGFENEQDFLHLHSTEFMTIVIAPSHYSIGSQFNGDSRICLQAKGGFRAINSDMALNLFKIRLENANRLWATEEYTIKNWHRWFRNLMDGSLVEPEGSLAF